MRCLVNLGLTLLNNRLLIPKSVRNKANIPARFINRSTNRQNMSTEPIKDTFKGRMDRFKGVIVRSDKEPCDISQFPKKLDGKFPINYIGMSQFTVGKAVFYSDSYFPDSISAWRENELRGIWFRVELEHSAWVPELAKKGFKFHHAKDDFVMMYLWLPQTENCNLPPFAHTMIGVGAVVVNDNKEILVVSEKYYQTPHWKLPGGYVEPGENLVDAAIREVWEETKIRTEFRTLLTLRQTHQGMFDCSDIYSVISLKPLNLDIEMCEREISECQWMALEEYLNHPNVHELNRFFVQKYLEYDAKEIKIDWRHGIHQTLNKPYTVYYITDKSNKPSKDERK